MEMLKAKTKKFNGRSYKISPLKEGPYKKGLVKNLMTYCARSLGQLKRASAKTRNDPNSVRIRQAMKKMEMLNEKKQRTKKGTGKHPGKKHGRRLYTDENPKDTVRIKFATPSDARSDCCTKVKTCK